MLKLFWASWINLLMPSFFGIGQGPTKEEGKTAGELSNIGSFAASTGEKDVSQSSDFLSAILSGDPTQLSRVLGPLYSNISKRGGQELKTLSEFGTRSGGTGAAQQQVGDEMRRSASDVEGKTLMGAAGELGTMGSGLVGTGVSAKEAAFSAYETIQKQKAAKMNDIFKSVMEVAGAVLGGPAMGAVAGGAGAAGAATSGGAADVYASSLPSAGNIS